MTINLLDYKGGKYSNIGNDGIIEYIFLKLNIERGIFVEVGAWDGIWNSNCVRLFEKKWQGIFIEADFERYDELKKNYFGFKNVVCCNAKIGFDKENLFDNVVNPFLKGKQIDFCSIDIDGLDLEVFETFEKYLPTVVCIEGGQMFDPFHKRVKKSIAAKNIQQSLKTMVDSFEKKGYKILCSYQDSFFIKKEYYHLFDVSDDLIALYFDGLRAIHRRIPFIQKYMKKVNLKNNIVNYVLKKSDYRKYGWKKRKKWAEDKKDIVIYLLDRKERKIRNGS